MQLEMEARQYEFEAQLADDNMMTTTQGLNETDNISSEATQAGNKKMNSSNLAISNGGKAGNINNTNNNNSGNGKMAAANTFSAFDNRTHRTDGNDAYFANTNPNAANRNDNNNNNNYQDNDESTSGPSGATMLSVENESCTIKDIVDRIGKVMQHDDLAAVRAQFVNLGDKNYSLYKYINELNSTKQKLQEQIRDLTRLIDEERTTQNEQRVIIAQYEEQLQCT